MKQVNSFYNRYWERRVAENRLYGTNGNRIPHRFFTACDMIRTPETAEPLSVLDLGCGDGTLGKLLREEKIDTSYLLGLDISRVGMQNAMTYYDEMKVCNFEEDDLDSLLEGKSFNTIVCLEVLEHLFNPFELLVKVRRYLKPGGHLIASFPNIAWWGYRLDLLRGEFPRGYSLFETAEHIQNFTVHSFTELLDKAGLEKHRMACEYKFPRLPGRFRLTRKAMGRFPGLFGYQIVIQARTKQEPDAGLQGTKGNQ